MRMLKSRHLEHFKGQKSIGEVRNMQRTTADLNKSLLQEVSDYRSLTLDRLRPLEFVVAMVDVRGVWLPHRAVVKKLFKR